MSSNQSVTKENYAKFMKAFKKCSYVNIRIGTTSDIDPNQWAASADATITLSWEEQGIKSSYTANFPANVVYGCNDIAQVAGCLYEFTMTQTAIAYLFEGLSKDGEISFRLEVCDTMQGKATRCEVDAGVNVGKKYYRCPVYSYTYNWCPLQKTYR